MSPSIIVLAIVATWAVVLVPRWVRRPHLRASQQWLPDVSEQDGQGWYDEYGADDDAVPDDAAWPTDAPLAGEGEWPAGAPPVGDAEWPAGAPLADDDGGSQARRPQPSYHEGPAPTAGRRRVLQARRRMLTILLVLAVLAAACTELRLASW